MVNAKLETQRQTIKHGSTVPIQLKEIHEITNIPLRTVERNLKKQVPLSTSEETDEKTRVHKPSLALPDRIYAIIVFFRPVTLLHK